MSAKKCIIDCDPGHDDFAALILLANSPSLDPQFVSTSHGNQTVDKTYNNARHTLNLINRADIPVYRGFPNPLVRKGRAAAQIHGESGLGGVDWDVVDNDLPRNPALDILGYKSEDELSPTDFFKHLHRLLQDVKEGERFDVIATAAMTNIAQYIMAYPEDAKKLRIQSMGGNFKVVGNVTPFAEFNVLVDPEAYNVVLNSDAEVIFAAPLDITHTILVDDNVMDRIQKATEHNSQVFYDIVSKILMFFKDSYKSVYGFPSPPLHDPVAVFYLLRPDLFEKEPCHVNVESKGEYTYGCCCHDLNDRKQNSSTLENPNTFVCLKLKEGGHEAFWDAMIHAFEVASKEAGKRKLN